MESCCDPFAGYEAPPGDYWGSEKWRQSALENFGPGKGVRAERNYSKRLRSSEVVFRWAS